jgi:hypothetical protein
MSRSHARKPLSMNAKFKTTRGFQIVALSALSVAGCKIETIYMSVTVGQKVTLRPEGMEGLPAIVSWTTGQAAGLNFEAPLHPAVVEHLCKTHPDESRPIEMDVGPLPPTAR